MPPRARGGAGTSQRPFHLGMVAQGGVRSLVLGAIAGAKAKFHRDEAAAAAFAPLDGFFQYGQAGFGEQARDFALQPDASRPHRGDLEHARELEAVFRVVGFDFHPPIMGARRAIPNRRPERETAASRRPSASSGGMRLQRDSCSRLEDTQPLLPSSSSTSHITPCLAPVGYSIMPTSRSRTTPLPSAPVNRRAGLVTVTACCALAAEASSGGPPSWATRSM